MIGNNEQTQTKQIRGGVKRDNRNSGHDVHWDLSELEREYNNVYRFEQQSLNKPICKSNTFRLYYKENIDCIHFVENDHYKQIPVKNVLEISNKFKDLKIFNYYLTRMEGNNPFMVLYLLKIDFVRLLILLIRRKVFLKGIVQQRAVIKSLADNGTFNGRPLPHNGNVKFKKGLFKHIAREFYVIARFYLPNSVIEKYEIFHSNGGIAQSKVRKRNNYRKGDKGKEKDDSSEEEPTIDMEGCEEEFFSTEEESRSTYSESDIESSDETEEDSISEQEVCSLIGNLKKMVSRTFASIGFSFGKGALEGATDELKENISKAKEELTNNMKRIDKEYTNGTIKSLMDFVVWIKNIIKSVIQVIVALLGKTFETIKTLCSKWKVFLMTLVSPIISAVSSLYKPLAAWFLGMLGFSQIRASKLKDYNYFKPFSALMDLFKMSQILPLPIYRRLESMGHYMKDHFGMITSVVNILLEKFNLSDYKILGQVDEFKGIVMWFKDWFKGTTTDTINRFVANPDQVPVLCDHMVTLTTYKVNENMLKYRGAITNMLRMMVSIRNMLPATISNRIKPLGICWGPRSGIGKSDILSEVTKMALLHVIRLDKELFAKYPNLTRANIAYGTSVDDEYESAYFGQLYDLVDEMFLTRDEESLIKGAKEWISKINTTPRIAVKSESELKGKIPYEPLLVNATTNLRYETFRDIKVDDVALYRRTLYLDAECDYRLNDEDYLKFQQASFMNKELFSMLDECYTITMIFTDRSDHFDRYLKLFKQINGSEHPKKHLYEQRCRDRGTLRFKFTLREIYDMIVLLVRDNIETHRNKTNISADVPTETELEELLLVTRKELGRSLGSGIPQSKGTLLGYILNQVDGKHVFTRPKWENYCDIFKQLDGSNPYGPAIQNALSHALNYVETNCKVRCGDEVISGGSLLRSLGNFVGILGFEGLPNKIFSTHGYLNWGVKWRETFDFILRSPIYKHIYQTVNKQFIKIFPTFEKGIDPETLLLAIQIKYGLHEQPLLQFEEDDISVFMGYEELSDKDMYYYNTTFDISVDRMFVYHITALFVSFFLTGFFCSAVNKILQKFGFKESNNLEVPGEPQSYNKIYNQRQKAARLARSTQLMDDITQGTAQSAELREHDYKVLSEFQRAIHPATFNYGEGYFGKAHIFNLFDHVFFAPYHNMRGRELQTIELCYGDQDNRKYIYRASDVKIIYENPDLEICIIKFINGSRLNRGKDLRKHFHEELDPSFESGRCVATLVEKYHKHFIFAESVREFKSDFQLRGLDWTCTGWFTRYALETRDSSCGLPYARKYGNKWYVNGFQFCLSDNGNSMSTFVSRDLLDKLYREHKYTTADTLGKFIPQSKLFKKVRENINYAAPVRDNWFPYNYIGTSQLRKYETSSSKYIKSVISEHLDIDNLVMPAIMERAYWKLPTGHVTKTDPYKKTKDSLRRVDCPPVCDIYKELCREHQDTLHQHQNRGLKRIRHRKLTDQEIIQGSNYVNGLRMDTSTGGFGSYNGIKKRAELFDKETGTIINEDFRKAVDEQREYAKKGILVCYPSMFAKKDETLSIEDVMPMTGAERITFKEYANLVSEGTPIYPEELLSKMRLFMMSCIVTLFNLMHINGVYNSYISHNLWGSMLVAYNPHGFEAEKVWLRLNQADNVILADHKGLDMSMPSLLLAEQIDYDAKWQGLIPETEEFIEYVTLLSSVYLSPVEFQGQIFEPINLHESGHGMTTPYNCNVTNQIVNTASKCAYPDKGVEDVDRFATGDDLAVMVPNSMSERLNHITLAGVSLLGFGLTMTTADKKKVTEPFFSGENYNHVSRTWKHHENGRVVHALKEDSITGMLHYVSKSLDPVVAIEQNIHAALLEAYKHGKEYYSDIESAIHNSLIDTGIVVKIPNWDFLNSHFSKRFMPGNVIHGNFTREVFGLDVNYDINTFNFEDLTC